jgi:hypothetical protein
MNLEQAQQLTRDLGVELGGSPDSYALSDEGEVHLSFEGQLPVHMRYYGSTLILSSIVATDIAMDDPGLFANLMDYQFMGIRTLGCVMSWNSGSDCLLLSRQLHGNPTARQLGHELNILLRASLRVKEEIKPLIEGDFSLIEQNSGTGAEAMLSAQLMRA